MIDPMPDFDEFLDGYYDRFIEALREFDRKPLSGVLKVFERLVEREATLWVAGNGGSAAIANHTVCDVTKGTFVSGQKPLRCISLAANVPIFTALGNDIGYEEVFRTQLQYYLKPDDALLLVSSSGNSPNVVKACEYANEAGIPTIAFVGFEGGRLKDIAQHSIWIPIDNYGIVEDTHQSLIHALTQFIYMTKQ